MGWKFSQGVVVAALLLGGAVVLYSMPNDRNPCTLGDQAACAKDMREIKCPKVLAGGGFAIIQPCDVE